MNVADRDIPLDESIAWLDRQVRSRVGPGMTARQREAKDIAESHVRLPSLEIVGYRSWLCEVCARELCKDAERWSWLACGRCRAVDAGVAHRLGGRRFLPLGRHSIMNGAGIPLPASEGPELTAMFERVVAMSDAWDRLHAWRDSEYARLAAEAIGLFAEPPDSVGLARWQEWFPPGFEGSADAYRRMLTLQDPWLVEADPVLGDPQWLAVSAAGSVGRQQAEQLARMAEPDDEDEL